MISKVTSACLALALSPITLGSGAYAVPLVGPPKWAAEGLTHSRVAVWPQDTSATFSVAQHLNPYYLHGDFDGDCRTDIAILVRRKSDRKLGIAVLFRASLEATFLGAGTSIGNGGDDFRWMDVWSVRARESLPPDFRNVWNDLSPQFKRDALFVEKSESASGLIYYDGLTFRWYQMGD